MDYNTSFILFITAITIALIDSNIFQTTQAFVAPNSMSMAGRSQRQSELSALRGDEKDGAKTAIVLMDPVTDWKQVINASLDLGHTVITVQMPDVALPPKFQSFLPTSQILREAGAEHTLSMHHRDVFSITQQLQILESECNLKVSGVIPLSEVAVEVSDLIASCMKLPHNPLDLMTARRDKGLMKNAVELAGLRVAKHRRVGCLEDVCQAMAQLAISYPVVIKTPSGMSTTDVFICSNVNEAANAMKSIIGEVGPDGRTVNMALLEEYLGGTEFAINIMAVKGEEGSRLFVTDMWKYQKTKQARYDNAEICNPADYPQLTSYACNVAKAVGIQYGAAHVELKAERDDQDGKYTDPIMIEVGARLSGGRKSTMAEAAINDWDPFTSLIESHSGQSCQGIPTDGNFLTPNKFVRHIFLPVEKAGRIKEVQFDAAATGALTTVHSSAIIVKAGDYVTETTDIVSCAGFVWLVGEKGQVDKDTDEVLSSFGLTFDEIR